MRAIWKFPLSSMRCDVTMPVDAQVLHVGQQDGSVFVWALVNATPGHAVERRRFVMLTTGEPVPNDVGIQRYIGTAHLDDLRFVLHVFDAGPA